MGKMRKKSELPTKVCVVCGRGFAWRKKWKREWEAVTYCSQACRRARRAQTSNQSAPALMRSAIKKQRRGESTGPGALITRVS
ncbi:MAG: DUF2256 domain-containing protein [Gammaproteobacteria bacterium]|nr:DUF2256 domain-containing protein [Gammaproteobacteria bacterium]